MHCKLCGNKSNQKGNTKTHEINTHEQFNEKRRHGAVDEARARGRGAEGACLRSCSTSASLGTRQSSPPPGGEGEFVPGEGGGEGQGGGGEEAGDQAEVVGSAQPPPQHLVGQLPGKGGRSLFVSTFSPF